MLGLGWLALCMAWGGSHWLGLAASTKIRAGIYLNHFPSSLRYVWLKQNLHPDKVGIIGYIMEWQKWRVLGSLQSASFLGVWLFPSYSPPDIGQ